MILMPNQSKGKNVTVVDPQLVMERMLAYREKHQGWHIFRTLYWSIFFLVVGAFLVYYTQLAFTATLFFGSVFVIFAVMLILYGLTEALHHKFMKKYG